MVSTNRLLCVKHLGSHFSSACELWKARGTRVIMLHTWTARCWIAMHIKVVEEKVHVRSFCVLRFAMPQTVKTTEKDYSGETLKLPLVEALSPFQNVTEPEYHFSFSSAMPCLRHRYFRSKGRWLGTRGTRTPEKPAGVAKSTGNKLHSPSPSLILFTPIALSKRCKNCRRHFSRFSCHSYYKESCNTVWTSLKWQQFYHIFCDMFGILGASLELSFFHGKKKGCQALVRIKNYDRKAH